MAITCSSCASALTALYRVLPHSPAPSPARERGRRLPAHVRHTRIRGVEDRALVYLTLRLAVAAAKGLAAALVTLLLVEIALALMYLIVAQGVAEAGAGLPGLGAILLAGAAGSVAYCSLFLLLGLLAPRRALLVGFLYVLLWEGTAAGFSTGLATLSVRRYVEGTLHAGLGAISGARLVWPADPSAATSALVVCAIVVVGLALTAYRLRRMELP